MVPVDGSEPGRGRAFPCPRRRSGPPHRPSPPWRAAALVLAIAAHNVLAKTLHAAPPEGIPAEQARAGAELTYYAGAPVEIALIFLVCRPWPLPRRRASDGPGVGSAQVT